LCARSACQIYDTIYGDFYENLAGIPQHRYTLIAAVAAARIVGKECKRRRAFCDERLFLALTAACHCFPFCIPTVPSAAALLPFIENCCKRAHEMSAHKKICALELCMLIYFAIPSVKVYCKRTQCSVALKMHASHTMTK
jgi:hypothetical protein